MTTVTEMLTISRKWMIMVAAVQIFRRADVNDDDDLERSIFNEEKV